MELFSIIRETIKKKVNISKKHLMNNNLGIKEYHLENTAYLFLTYKYLNKEFDIDEIYRLIREVDKIEFKESYHLYKLLEDTSYLETAYSQVKELAYNLEPNVKAKFLG